MLVKKLIKGFYLYPVLFCLIPGVFSQFEQACTLTCGNNIRSTIAPRPFGNGPPGPQGPPGKRGPPGNVAHCSCSLDETAQRKIAELESKMENSTKPPSYGSCKDIKLAHPNSNDGVYVIRSEGGYDYQVYCDMQTNGGGWTLVASVHENNIREGGGRCTPGDRWSSEQGVKKQGLRGDGNWENFNTFGHFASATSDDYKSPAYFELQAEDLMMWHTPNDTPLLRYNTSSFLKYRTTDGFLSQYGGNLRSLYADHYPILSQTYSFPDDSGPSIPVVYDHGTSIQITQLLPPNTAGHVDVGYVQFRAISTYRDAFAICPGIRNKPTFLYPSQTCLGSSGFTSAATYCGDFSGLLHDGHAFGSGWSAKQQLLESAFLMFYK